MQLISNNKYNNIQINNFSNNQFKIKIKFKDSNKIFKVIILMFNTLNNHYNMVSNNHKI